MRHVPTTDAPGPTRRRGGPIVWVALLVLLWGCGGAAGERGSRGPQSGDGDSNGVEAGESKSNDPTPRAATSGDRGIGDEGNGDKGKRVTPQVHVETRVERLRVKVLAAHPHDPTAFTQGLLWEDGVLYESTGLYGRSSLRRVDPMTGEVLEQRPVEKSFFAEGLAKVENRLLQLTWKAGVVLVYDAERLIQIDELGYNGQGWGLAWDGERLIMSDGSSRLTFRDPEDFHWMSTLEVHLEGEPVKLLNELEFAQGRVWANIWGEDRIVRIDPTTGAVDGVVDAAGLLQPAEKPMVDVLNGIAYDPDSETFWLTGKFWSKTFQVVFVPDD